MKLLTNEKNVKIYTIVQTISTRQKINEKKNFSIDLPCEQALDLILQSAMPKQKKTRFI